MIHSTSYPDNRGRFQEAFRKDWISDLFSDQLQINCSHSKAGVIRGLHFHKKQTDYWFPVSGSFRVGLADMRPESPTFRKSVSFDLCADDPVGLVIPPGVAHGYAALTDAVLIYMVNRYFDGSDEFGVAWNDPVFALDWGIESPILSERDRSNPVIGDIH